MAGIDNLKKRILKDDEEKAVQIENEAKTQALDILDKATVKAEALLKDALKKAEKDGEERKERLISRTRLEARNKILAAKQDSIDMILKHAKEKIDSMELKEYTDFLESMLLGSTETGDEEVIFSEDDMKRIDLSFIDRINAKLSSQGKKGLLNLSCERRDIKSGFILKHGGIEVNCSIDSQIRMLRDSLEGELAKLLFDNR